MTVQVDVKKKSPRARLRTAKEAAGETITADCVIKNLLDLFRQLGVEAKYSLHPSPLRPSDDLYRHAFSIGELLTYWHQASAYLDQDGNPLTINLKGRQPSFSSLAKRFVPGLRRVVLASELQRLGIVRIENGNMIRILARSFPAYEDKQLAVQHTLTILNGFLETLRHNLNSPATNSNQLFHRIARHNHFDRREIAALKVRVKRYGQDFLESFDNWLRRRVIPRTRRDKNSMQTAEVSVGIYLTVEKDVNDK